MDSSPLAGLGSADVLGQTARKRQGKQERQGRKYKRNERIGERSIKCAILYVYFVKW